MKSLTVRQILEAVCGELLHGNPEDVINGISTDTRVVSKGEAFFALIGEQHDAHDFIPQAIDRGCSLVVLSKMPENQLLQTNNVLLTQKGIFFCQFVILENHPLNRGKTTTRQNLPKIAR
jgi:UDP-N-acetylmuramyl pentapeptide synthase